MIGDLEHLLVLQGVTRRQSGEYKCQAQTLYMETKTNHKFDGQRTNYQYYMHVHIINHYQEFSWYLDNSVSNVMSIRVMSVVSGDHGHSTISVYTINILPQYHGLARETSRHIR